MITKEQLLETAESISHREYLDFRLWLKKRKIILSPFAGTGTVVSIPVQGCSVTALRVYHYNPSIDNEQEFVTEINWPSLGSVDVEIAKNFRIAMTRAIRVAGLLKEVQS